ncbi:DUF3090 domain-containing protein [soil metagenome]
MSSSFDFAEPDHFTAGTLGEPGNRVFYLQAREGASVVSLRCEKQQVAALADYLGGVMRDLPEADGPGPTELELIEPVVAEWVVGTLGVAYDEDSDRLVLLAQELGEDEPGEGEDPIDDDAATVRLRLTREQVAAFIGRAQELLTAGRPPCPICGRPLDPEGHVCPRTNGHHPR